MKIQFILFFSIFHICWSEAIETSAQFENAILSAPTNGSEIILNIEGNFLISGTISVPNQANIKIYGNGYTLIFKDNFYIESGSFVYVERLLFKGVRLTNSSIFIHGSFESYKCNFFNFLESAIIVESGYIKMIECDFFSIGTENSNLASQGGAIHSISTQTLYITSCNFYNNTAHEVIDIQ